MPKSRQYTAKDFSHLMQEKHGRVSSFDRQHYEAKEGVPIDVGDVVLRVSMNWQLNGNQDTYLEAGDDGKYLTSEISIRCSPDDAKNKAFIKAIGDKAAHKLISERIIALGETIKKILPGKEGECKPMSETKGAFTKFSFGENQHSHNGIEHLYYNIHSNAGELCYDSVAQGVNIFIQQHHTEQSKGKADSVRSKGNLESLRAAIDEALTTHGLSGNPNLMQDIDAAFKSFEAARGLR